MSLWKRAVEAISGKGEESRIHSFENTGVNPDDLSTVTHDGPSNSYEVGSQELGGISTEAQRHLAETGQSNVQER